ncbi:hypothetical protein V8G54_021514 [Vigna mungo]|uniref:Uncharacterized protein n=1 Tax=Vigna mungo TaxID=3915 RepID=A0AAQ3NHI7_VIGMU
MKISDETTRAPRPFPLTIAVPSPDSDLQPHRRPSRPNPRTPARLKRLPELWLENGAGQKPCLSGRSTTAVLCSRSSTGKRNFRLFQLFTKTIILYQHPFQHNPSSLSFLFNLSLYTTFFPFC